MSTDNPATTTRTTTMSHAAPIETPVSHRHLSGTALHVAAGAASQLRGVHVPGTRLMGSVGGIEAEARIYYGHLLAVVAHNLATIWKRPVSELTAERLNVLIGSAWSCTGHRYPETAREWMCAAVAYVDHQNGEQARAAGVLECDLLDFLGGAA